MFIVSNIQELSSNVIINQFCGVVLLEKNALLRHGYRPKRSRTPPEQCAHCTPR